MPERTDKYESLVPHHRRKKSEADKAFDEYIAEHPGATAKEVFISGWEKYQAKCKNLYSIEDIKNIIN